MRRPPGLAQPAGDLLATSPPAGVGLGCSLVLPAPSCTSSGWRPCMAEGSVVRELLRALAFLGLETPQEGNGGLAATSAQLLGALEVAVQAGK